MKAVRYCLCVLSVVLIVSALPISGRTIRYYIGVVETEWDYLPKGPAGSSSSLTTFRKIVYRKYTNRRFEEQSPHSDKLGFYGPVLSGEVEDTIVIKLRNFASIPVSIATDGIETSTNITKQTDPGMVNTYTWKITDSNSPIQNDPICVPRLYYSDVNLNKDINSGCAGCLLICKKYGTPDENELDNILFFAKTDEGSTWFDAPVNLTSSELIQHNINGYIRGNLPELRYCVEETHTLYLLGLSSSPTIFPVMFTGVTVQVSSKITNTVNVYPGSYAVAMVTTPRVRGHWKFFSAINEHQGMSGFLRVMDCEENEGRFPSSRRRQRGRNKECPESEVEQLNVRTFYVAAEEYMWDYAPYSYDFINGNNLRKKGSISYERYQSAEGRIGGIYIKARFVEYTNEKFTQVKQRSSREKYLGFLGPILRIEVGEVLRVVFKNMANRPYNMWIPQMEQISNFVNEDVQPAEIRIYEWKLPPNVGPSHLDGHQCFTSVYLSSVEFIRDVSSGLIGPVLFCQQNSLNEDNTQKNIDREIFMIFGTFDENESWYIDENLMGATGEVEENITFWKESQAFKESNFMYAINGYAYGHVPNLIAYSNEMTSLHFVCIGREDDAHVITFMNQTLTDGFYVDDESSKLRTMSSVSLVPWSMKTVYMLPGNEGSLLMEDANWRAVELGSDANFSVIESPLSSGDIYKGDSDQTRERNVRWFYLAAVELEWDYAPGGNEQNRNSTFLFKKVKFQEFTDSTFSELKESNLNLGIVGPEIRAETGDVIKIVFQNQGCRPFSIRPKGLDVKPNDAGKWVMRSNMSAYSDFYHFTPDFDSPGVVWPGHIHTYTWYVPDDYEPLRTNRFAKCSPSFYYSGVDPIRDTHSGLLGPILICKNGYFDSLRNGVYSDVIEEHFLIFKTFNETQTWYYLENLRRMQVDFDVTGTQQMVYSTINGYSHGTSPTIGTLLNEYVVWHSANVDSFLHSVNFERNLAFSEDIQDSGEASVSSTKVLLPGEAKTYVMVPLLAGHWKIRDFVTDNEGNGMFCYYQVTAPDCSKPLGIRSRVISDRQMSASTTYVKRGLFGHATGRWKPGNARLHNTGYTNAWIPSRSDKKPWLQVDLRATMRVSGIVIQGVRVGVIRKFVKVFQILYSVDREQWTYAKRLWGDNRMSFSGNTDANTPVVREFVPRIVARYIKIMVILWHHQPALRIELLGCEQTNGCETHLGVQWIPGERPRIPDESLSASSVFTYKNKWRWEPKLGRLNYKNGNEPPSWSPSKSSRRQWIQVDLGERMHISGIITQGALYKKSRFFVKTFLIRYSYDGYDWYTFKDPVSGKQKIFHGNFDAETPLSQPLGKQIEARYLRILPWTWYGRIALRFEVIGCQVGEEQNVEQVTPFPEDCIADVIGGDGSRENATSLSP